MKYKNKHRIGYLNAMLDEYRKIRKELDEDPYIYVFEADMKHEPFIHVRTDLNRENGTNYPYMARTMEYIQGLKHDTDMVIERIECELNTIDK